MTDSIETPTAAPSIQPDESNTLSPTAEDAPTFDITAFTDRALTFLSTASNETLGACLVGLGASTYLILGRVGLLLIGVVGGVVLHATWEGQGHGASGHDAGQTTGRKRELGIDIAHRVLNWRGTEGKNNHKNDDTDDSDLAVRLFAGKELDYSEFRPETAAALTELTDAVIRDYVKYVVCHV